MKYNLTHAFLGMLALFGVSAQAQQPSQMECDEQVLFSSSAVPELYLMLLSEARRVDMNKELPPDEMAVQYFIQDDVGSLHRLVLNLLGQTSEHASNFLIESGINIKPDEKSIENTIESANKLLASCAFSNDYGGMAFSLEESQDIGQNNSLNLFIDIILSNRFEDFDFRSEKICQYKSTDLGGTFIGSPSEIRALEPCYVALLPNLEYRDELENDELITKSVRRQLEGEFREWGLDRFGCTSGYRQYCQFFRVLEVSEGFELCSWDVRPINMNRGGRYSIDKISKNSFRVNISADAYKSLVDRKRSWVYLDIYFSEVRSGRVDLRKKYGCQEIPLHSETTGGWCYCKTSPESGSQSCPGSTACWRSHHLKTGWCFHNCGGPGNCDYRADPTVICKPQ